MENNWLKFSFAVKEQNMDLIRETVAAVSDPRSQSYGEYLSTEEIDDLTKPLASDVEIVTKWLSAHNIFFLVQLGGRKVSVECSVAQAELLLRTSIRTLTNDKTNQKVVKALGQYSLPSAVHEVFADLVKSSITLQVLAYGADAIAFGCDHHTQVHLCCPLQVVSGVFGLHDLPLPPKVQFPGSPAKVTPAVLASTYSIAGVKPTGSVKNLMAVAEFQGQYMRDSDLVAFFSRYVPHAQKGDDQVYKFVGSPNKQQGAVEASLDIQYMMGVAPHVKSEFWLFAPMAFCSDLKNWTTTILADAQAPLVHSVSYGATAIIVMIVMRSTACCIPNV